MPENKKNQKLGIPRLEQQRMLSVKQILDGRRHAFYGKGQKPEAGEPGKYEPPKEWLESGRLLRMPRMVWLTVALRDRDSDARITIKPPLYDIEGGFLFTKFTGENIVLPGGVSGCALDTETNFVRGHWTSGEDPPPTVYDAPVHKTQDEERRRVLGVFDEVVRYLDDVRIPVLFSDVYPEIDPDTGRPLPWAPEKSILPLVCPRSSEPYLGVDFLHVHVGLVNEVDAFLDFPGDYDDWKSAWLKARPLFRRLASWSWCREQAGNDLPAFDGFPALADPVTLEWDEANPSGPVLLPEIADCSNVHKTIHLPPISLEERLRYVLQYFGTYDEYLAEYAGLEEAQRKLIAQTAGDSDRELRRRQQVLDRMEAELADEGVLVLGEPREVKAGDLISRIRDHFEIADD